ncbi:hypothetical protein DT075_02360 [Bacillus licheniformis]|nr:hypothetical protein DT075_02360 [Bacillus licheniformis]
MELIHEALPVLEAVIEQDENCDIISGSAGALMVLMSLYEQLDDPVFLKLAEKCAGHLLQHKTFMSYLSRFAKRPETYSHITEQCVFAIQRALNELKEKEEFLKYADSGAFTGVSGYLYFLQHAGTVQKSPRSGALQPLAIAEKAADDLAEKRIEGNDGKDVTWISTVIEGVEEISWTISPVSLDLYNGNAGIGFSYLLNGEEEPIAAYFETPSFTRVIKKISSFSDQDLKEQANVIRMSILAAYNARHEKDAIDIDQNHP